jgi:hypothetical protein
MKRGNFEYMSEESNKQQESPYVTAFSSEKLLGYQCDETGKFRIKVFKAEACMSDNSIWILYGTKNADDYEDIKWVVQPNQPQPIIHRDRFGIWVVDPKTIIKKND